MSTLMALREICEFMSWDENVIDELLRVKIFNENEAKMLHAFMKKQKC